MKRVKIQTAVIVVLMVHSINFGNFMKLILTLIPKYYFILMTCSAVMQMYKKIDVRKKLFKRSKHS
jgi:hypothetical protein